MQLKHLAVPLFLWAMACAGPALGQNAHPDHPEHPPLPAVALKKQLNGEEAIQGLGDNLPGVAAHHGMSAEKLSRLLRSDHDLWVDRGGRLFYADSNLPEPAEAAAADTGAVPEEAIVPLDQTFRLHSRPGATRKIYLDFNGHTTSGTIWQDVTDGDHTFVTPPFDMDGNPGSFSTTELDRIQYIWQRVAEDYAPFDVDVTTEDPGVDGLVKSSSTDTNYGNRVAIGGYSTDWYSTSVYGGVAHFSFGWDSDTPCYAFAKDLNNGDEKDTAEAISHEVGHTLHLHHDGNTAQAPYAYYWGHGSGAYSWAPIMGTGYEKTVVQFSKGEYAYANNTEDDLAIISTYTPYIPDDYGNDFASATALPAGPLSVDGVIARNTDVDMFKLSAGSGSFIINIGVDSRSPNLNVKATLYNHSGAVVAVSDPAAHMTAAFNLTGMPAGTYYLAVEGVGNGDANTGFTKYGSLGHYAISGSVPVSGIPVAVASATPTSGYAPLAVQFSSIGSQDPDGGILNYFWDLGNGTTSIEPNPSADYSTPGTYTAVLTVTDDQNFKSSARVPITVQEKPTLPSPPAQLTASAVSRNQINLKWADTATNETGFYLERSINGGGWSRIATLGANTTSYANTGLSRMTTYSYRVRAFNATGASAYSNTVTAKTPKR